MRMKILESRLQTGTFIYKLGISVTKQDFHLQSGSLALQRGFSAYYLPYIIVCQNVFCLNSKNKLQRQSFFAILRSKNRVNEVAYVKVSFKKLFKLLIDRDMKKNELASAANLSANTIAKLSKNENVSLDVLIRICSALNVEFGDIMELVPDDD